MKKKLIFIATNALGTRSAEATHNVEMAMHLNQEVPVTFIGGIKDGQSVPDQLSQINDLQMIICNSKQSKMAHIEYEFMVIKKLKEIMKNHPQCLVYVRYRITGVFLFRYLIKNKIPYIVEYNDKTTTQLKYFAKVAHSWSYMGKLFRTNLCTLWLLERYEAWVFRNAVVARAVTQQLGDYIKSITNNKAKTTVIPNATNTERFKPMDKAIARTQLKLPHDTLICTHIGSLTPWDGIQDMIQALAELENILFVVVGNKNQFYTTLHELAQQHNVQDKVLFTGGKDQHIVQQYIAASDICLLLKAAMDYGLSPIKYYEYMACGRPILTINDSLVNNVVQDQCGAVLDTPIESDAIVKKINDMKAMDLDTLGSNARKAAEKKYTWQHRADQLLPFILS